MTGLIILIVIVAGIAVFLISNYNRLVSLRNRVRNSFSQIDVQLKRRYDLIPNLVETAKGYMKHEKDTLEAVINARSRAMSGLTIAAKDPADAAAIQELMAAEGALTGALGKLLAISESYPDLKANQNMMQLTEELTSTENKVSFARQSYNDSVMGYNNACEQFPSSVIAGMFNFARSQFFEIVVETEREAPKVSF